MCVPWHSMRMGEQIYVPWSILGPVFLLVWTVGNQIQF